MPEIDLDSDIFEYLQSQAEPFVDTPNTVLRRLLNIDRAESDSSEVPTPAKRRARRDSPGKRTIRPRSTRVRAAAGTLLPEDQYELPLLRALVEAGGRAPYREIVDSVGIELKDSLLPADFETLNSGTVRWQSRLQFVRLRLIERGLLAKDMPRGVWGITDAGREVLNAGVEQ
jgi:hypothetical protein